ncbi:hypothetical protein [Pseudorhizobium banfieldiae]|nr:hypothetical protein [Pseudorhizobium banfieldiae]
MLTDTTRSLPRERISLPVFRKQTDFAGSLIEKVGGVQWRPARHVAT